MDPVTLGLMGLQGVGAIQGLLGARRAAALARARRDQAIQDYLASMDSRRQNDAVAGNRAMYGYAGQGGDAIAAAYQTGMANDAGAGVYGSTATAGMRQKALDSLASGIADMDVRNRQHLSELYAEAQGNAARMRACYATEDLAGAQGDYQGAVSGLAGLAGGLQQMTQPRVSSTQGLRAGLGMGAQVAGGMMGVPGAGQMMGQAVQQAGGFSTAAPSLGVQAQQQFQGVRDGGRAIGPAQNGMNNGSLTQLSRGINRIFTLPSNRRRPGKFGG